MTPQSLEERLATVRLKNGARRESILSSIQLPVWMNGLNRINKFEMVYAQCPMDKMTTVDCLKEKVWTWLTRDQEIVLSRGSVSANTLDKAFEAWGIASMSELADVEAKQKIIYSEVNRLITEAVPKEDLISGSSNQPIVAQSAVIPSPTQVDTGEIAQPMIVDQNQDPKYASMQVDLTSPLVPRASCEAQKRARNSQESLQEERLRLMS